MPKYVTRFHFLINALNTAIPNLIITYYIQQDYLQPRMWLAKQPEGLLQPRRTFGVIKPLSSLWS